LASGVPVSQTEDNCTTPELLTPVGSVEYMAPEVVDAWVGESFSSNTFKRKFATHKYV
jgi:hypothetical protein